jgi:hypothetical protein
MRSFALVSRRRSNYPNSCWPEHPTTVSACDVREFSIGASSRYDYYRSVDAITPGLFFVETSSVRLVVFPVPPVRCFCGCGVARWSRHLRGQNFAGVTSVRTVADPCPRNFLSVIVVRGEASYCKSRSTPLINRFFCLLWRSSHLRTRSRGHNYSNAIPFKVFSFVFAKNITFISIRFVLLYYCNTLGSYVILLLFLDLSNLLLFFFFLLILLWRFWPVYTGVCYNFINYPR